jgi:hypothetical protein
MLVLVPYQEDPKPGDPHALAITESFGQYLGEAGLPVTTIAPRGHLAAVADAAQICADNHVNGLLIPEGRYVQTRSVSGFGYFVMIEVMTHVEFRVDEIGCDGTIRWSTTTNGDTHSMGHALLGGPANVNAAIDAAFRSAEHDTVRALTGSTVPTAVAAVPPPAPAPPPAAPSSYLLVPFSQPSFDDEHFDDVTSALLKQLLARNLVVKVGEPIDHLAAISRAPALCQASGAQAIIVPGLRVEQGPSGASHAEMHVALVSCIGTVLSWGWSSADTKVLFLGHYDGQITKASEKAMPAVLDQLLAPTTAAAPKTAG